MRPPLSILRVQAAIASSPRRLPHSAASPVAGAAAGLSVATTSIQNNVSASQWAQISSRITCTAGPNVGDQVKITIKYPYTIGLQGVSASGELTASATERME